MIAFSRRWTRRSVDYVVLPLLLVLMTLILVLRLWALPNIDRWRDDIAASISHSAGQRVTLGEINADWRGLHPHLRIQDIRVFGVDGRPALVLANARAVLSWTSLLHGELRLALLSLDDIALTVRRDGQGIHVAGLALNQSDSSGGFGDWLLAQRRIQVNHATLAWSDELRDAPYLVARDVNFTLQNRGQRHRFRLTAVPPAQLAKPLDIRGDFTGRSLDTLASWRGRLYARVDHADLRKWRPWLTFPYALEDGDGGLRVWLEIARKQVIAVTADVALHNVAGRLAPDFPKLRLTDLSGRGVWKRLGAGQMFAVQRLQLRSADFLHTAPFDLSLRLHPAGMKTPARTSMEGSNIQIDRLARLTPYLPLPRAQQRRIAELQPRGQLQNFSLVWHGDASQPLDYQIKGRFTRLGWQAQGNLPGAEGLSGNMDATRSNGTLALNSQRVRLSLPRVLHDPDVAFTALTAQMSWRERKQGYLFKLTEASFANTDLAGSAFGDYRFQSGQRGNIDLTARLTRMDGRHAYRYLPLKINTHTYHWMKNAVQAGQASEMRVRLKGDLDHFPFRGERKGLFELAVKVENGVLQYAPDWPRIEGIRANLLFRGERMGITSDQASIYGAALNRVSATIPDLFNGNEMLEIKGEARGPADAFVRFSNTSPVKKILGGVTNRLNATGNLRLGMYIQVPMRRARAATFAGDLDFDGNTLAPAYPFPSLQNIQGRLQFTHAGILAQNIEAQLLGGPVRISAASQPRGVTRLLARGRMSAAGLRPFLNLPLAGHFGGAADWRATIHLRRLQVEADFESNLVGLTSNLPPPFAKTAAENQPLRIKKIVRNADESLLSIQYGKLASALLLQKQQGQETVTERGAVHFGGDAGLPEESGLWITGALPLSDLDRWRAQLTKWDDAGNGGRGVSGLPPLAGVDLTFRTLDLFGRRFQDIHINAHKQSDAWQARVAGRGVDGEVTWQAADRQAGRASGKLGAHFESLSIPPARLAEEGKSAPTHGGLPALDIRVANLQLGNRPLGRLDVGATPLGSGLHFDNIRLTHPDSTLTMQGVWSPDRIPQTQAKIRLEVNDAGNFLERFGHPDLVRRGQATVEGEGEWNGTPVDIAIPSLSGTFALQATRGQFAKINPGIGKLLGVLSLQALPRRIGLDFRDVFSDGFAFDEISGTMRMSRGVIYSDNFRMQGPAAQVKMSGLININAETQQLRVAVTPKLSESVALAGTLIGGPIVGLGALAVQKLLKDPLGQAATFQYRITGDWTDPVVARMPRRSMLDNAAGNGVRP